MQGLYDGGFPTPGSPIGIGLFFFAPTEDLADTFNFHLSAYNGIQSAFFGGTGHITAKVVQYGFLLWRHLRFLGTLN